MPSERANTIKHAAFSKAKTTPTQKRPEVAAAMMPTPIRPKVSIGPLTTASGDGFCERSSRTRTGIATPASTVVHQAGTREVSIPVDALSRMAKILTEAPGIVDRLYQPYCGTNT